MKRPHAVAREVASRLKATPTVAYPAVDARLSTLRVRVPRAQADAAGIAAAIEAAIAHALRAPKKTER